jgi:heme-degrading monooxygenase HmoA
MIIELRTYVPVKGREQDLVARFRDSTLDILKRRGIDVTDLWIAESDSEVVYLVRWDNAEEMTAAWAAFREDPEWIRVKGITEAEGPLVASIASKVLVRPPFFTPDAASAQVSA